VTPIVRAAEIIRATVGARLHVDVPLAPLTSLRVGGRAALYLEPEHDADLRSIARAVAETGIAWTVIGKGSNVLVSDDGFDGLVVRLGRGYRWTARDGELLTAGGAMPLPALSGVALGHGLGGLEFGVAIPASLGGAVKMNAGAHTREMADVVATVDLFDVESGATHSAGVSEAGFSYRRSAFPATSIVVGATFRLEPKDQAAIRLGMDEARDWRRRTQPLAEPNCGSVFKNPPGGHAARLIEDAGMKGARVGGARVSEKHANFIVTEPGARAREVASLMSLVREKVLASAGIDLEPEVQLIGGVHA
jgi:UDP-N-acetylmuramate dehydrogenase